MRTSQVYHASYYDVNRQKNTSYIKKVCEKKGVLYAPLFSRYCCLFFHHFNFFAITQQRRMSRISYKILMPRT